MDDEDKAKQPLKFEVGMNIDDMSVDELHEQIGVLENEIKRLRDAISVKSDSRSAADAVFKI